MTIIVVEQFLGSSWVDVHVVDADTNELWETLQGLDMAEAYIALTRFRDKYETTEGVVKVYDKDEVQVQSVKIKL